MNGQRLVISLLFALLCSGTFTWQLRRHLSQTASTTHPVSVRSVLVASHDLSAGQKLSEASLTLATIPATVTMPGLLSRPQEVTGHVLAVPVSAGEPLFAHDLAGKDTLGAPLSPVPPGYRLVSIPGIDAAAADFLKPGNHVDVFVTYRTGAEGLYTGSLVLQNVTVGSTQEQRAEATGAPSRAEQGVGLLMTPEQAARLTVASSLGKLTYALRSPGDDALSSGLSYVTLEVSESSGRHGGERQTARTRDQAEPKGFTVETLTGGKSSIQTFQRAEQ